MTCKLLFLSLFSFLLLPARSQRQAPDQETATGGTLTIQPVMHASLVLSYQDKSIYIDPAGGGELFKGLAAPAMIMITDIHGDHLDTATINAVNTANAVFVVPQAVADKLPATVDKQRVVVLKKRGNDYAAKILVLRLCPCTTCPKRRTLSIRKEGATAMCLP